MTDEFDDFEALATNYVLGTLDQAERWRAERLIAGDPGFAGQVETWNQRLWPLLLAIPPEVPSPRVWQDIQAALNRHGTSASSPPARRTRVALLERLEFWRWCALGASAVAAALAIYIGVRPLLPTQGPAKRYVAVLTQEGTDPAWLVTVDIARQELTIQPVARDPAADRAPTQALELWLVAGDGTAPPRSLGLLSPETETSLMFPAVAGLPEPEAAVLAVSLEPPGGSPTGLPTGPVVYQGKILPIASPAAEEEPR